MAFQRLNRQPQSPARIDWSNPLSRKLRAFYVFYANGRVYNAVSNQFVVPTAVSNARFSAAGPLGLAIASTTGLGKISINDVSLQSPVSGGECAIAYGAFLPAGVSAYEYIGSVKGLYLKLASSNNGAGNIGISMPGVADVPSGIMRSGSDHWHVLHGLTFGGTMDTTASSSKGVQFASVALPVGGSSTSDTEFLSSYGEGCPSGTMLYYLAEWDRKPSSTEAKLFVTNPWQLLQGQQRRILFDSPAGGATDTPINPGAGSLTLTGFAPSLARTANQALTAGAGAITITGYAPSVASSAALNLTPAVGAMTITGYAPSISQPKTVTAGAGAMTVTGYAPTVSRTVTGAYSPTPGALTITGFAPTVFVQAPIAVSPGYGVITLTGYPPSISQGLPNLYPVFNRTVLMMVSPTEPQSAKTATQVYNVSGSTQFMLFVIRPDGSEFTSFPQLGLVDLPTVDQGTFAAGKYSVYTFGSSDLSLPGDYLMRHAYQDTNGQVISQVNVFTIKTQ